jgi:hypothetical protein
MLNASALVSRDLQAASNILAPLIDASVKNALEDCAPGIVKREMLKIGALRRLGRTAGELWRIHGFQVLRNGPQWLSGRLVRAGCQVGNSRVELGNQTACLFDPDKVRAWLRRGGRVAVLRYIDERNGQLKLPLGG